MEDVLKVLVSLRLLGNQSGAFALENFHVMLNVTVFQSPRLTLHSPTIFSDEDLLRFSGVLQAPKLTKFLL